MKWYRQKLHAFGRFVTKNTTIDIRQHMGFDNLKKSLHKVLRIIICCIGKYMRKQQDKSRRAQRNISENTTPTLSDRQSIHPVNMIRSNCRKILKDSLRGKPSLISRLKILNSSQPPTNRYEDGMSTSVNTTLSSRRSASAFSP